MGGIVYLGGDGGGTAIFELHASHERAQGVLPHVAPHAREVNLVHAVPRMQQTVGQFAVVGEQQDTFGVLVETANREHALGRPWTQSRTVSRPWCPWRW